LPWQPEFCMEWNSLNSFVKASHKEHPCEVSLWSALWFQRRCHLKSVNGQRTTDNGRRTTDDGRRVILIAHPEHMLRWAKNLALYFIGMSQCGISEILVHLENYNITHLLKIQNPNFSSHKHIITRRVLVTKTYGFCHKNIYLPKLCMVTHVKFHWNPTSSLTCESQTRFFYL
jgi:hypothetical protein